MVFREAGHTNCRHSRRNTFCNREPLQPFPFGRLDTAAHEVIIPEPATLALLGTGLGLLGVRRRRKVS